VPSVAVTVEGVSDDGVEASVEVVAAGNAQPNEGFELLAGESKEFAVAVPIGDVYATANAAAVPIEIIEG
jgi:hypothetical protein